MSEDVLTVGGSETLIKPKRKRPKAIKAAAKPAPVACLECAKRARMFKQRGQYMGLTHQLGPTLKKQARKILDEKGTAAAIAFLRKRNEKAKPFRARERKGKAKRSA